MKKLNKKYIKGKTELKTKFLGYLHTHIGGYYDKECGGCIAEGLYEQQKDKENTQ